MKKNPTGSGLFYKGRKYIKQLRRRIFIKSIELLNLEEAKDVYCEQPLLSIAELKKLSYFFKFNKTAPYIRLDKFTRYIEEEETRLRNLESRERKNLNHIKKLIKCLKHGRFSSIVDFVRRSSYGKESLLTHWINLKLSSIIHQQVNRLFLEVCTRNSTLLRKHLKKYGYHPYLYKPGFDPFEAAFDIGDCATLNVIADYLTLDEKSEKKDDGLRLSKFKEGASDHLMGMMEIGMFTKVMKTHHKKLQDHLISNLFEEDLYSSFKGKNTIF